MDSDNRDPNDWLHAALARLSYPPAPPTLLPRVMAAVARRWYARAWVTWPRAWQVASAAAVVAVVAGAWVLVPAAPAVVGLAGAGEAVAALSRALWQALVQPALAYVTVLVMFALVTCAAGWAALSRLVPGGASS